MSESEARLFTLPFIVLMIGGSVFFAGTGVLNALVPLYVVDELGGTEAVAGIVMGSIAITSLVCRPFIGRYADRYGSRRILLFGAVLSALSLAMLPVGPESVAMVVVSRMLLGVGMAGMFVGTTLLAVTLAPPMRQGQAASMMLVSVHAGLGLGPIAGLWLLDRSGFDAVWWAVAAAAGLSGVVFLRLPKPPVSEDHTPAPLIHRAAIPPGIVTFFGVFALNGFLTFASLYGREVGVEDVALLFTAVSGTIVIVRLFAGHVPDVIGPIRAGSGALILTACATVVLAFWQEPAGAFAGGVLLACGISMQAPSFIPLAIVNVPDNERGAAMATFTGFYDIANAVIGPLIGLIVAGSSYRVAFLFSGCMSLVALAILRLVVAPSVRDRPLAPARNLRPRRPVGS